MAIATMRSDSRKGIRHPHALNAAILAAETQTLDQAKQQQQDACRCPDPSVAWHETNQSRRQTHAAQRDEEGVLTAHEVADAAEHEGSERMDQEPGGEGPDRLDE